MENNKSPTEIKKVQPAIPRHLIKIPKEVILQPQLSEHRISVFTYLNYNQTWNDTVHYSPIYMIESSGYKANWRTGKKENIYGKFKSSMQWFFENGYILDFDDNKFIQNIFQSSLINKEKLLPTDNFALLYDFEIDAIMKYKSPYKPLNKSILLLLLAYIRAFTWMRKTEITGHSEKSKKLKPEIFHSQFKTMENFIGVNYRLISKATDVLQEMRMIKTHRMPNYQDETGQWHTDDIIYICPYRLVSNKGTLRFCTKEEYDWQKELEYGIKYLRDCNYSSKKFYQM